MAQVPTKEGRIPFKLSSIDTPCETFYKVFGDLSCGAPPVVMLHGGPGAGHEYLLPFADLWPRYGMPVVFYDQIGCASSTHLPHTNGDKDFWQLSVFIAELENLLDYLHLRDGPGYHLFGQSFGGMLGADFATSRPRGLQRLVLANALASKQLGIRGRELNVAQLPAEVIRALNEGRQKGDYESAAFKEAMAVYNKKHLCNSDPLPPEMMFALKNLNEDKTVQGTMNGPTVLVQNGSMLHWTCVPRLHQIIAPTLVYNGEFDGSHDIAQVPFFEHIPRVRWVTISHGSHMTHLEGDGRREQVFVLVGDFLTQGMLGKGDGITSEEISVS